jgi:lysophospholipase L1-like esterase
MANWSSRVLSARSHPISFVLGFVVAFLGCVAAGYFNSSHNLFENFTRFHQLIAPESHFYPTARQVRALGLAMLNRSKTNVIVGGSSVMYGVGQPTDQVWTKELSKILGDGYRVLNLAMRGGDTAGIASFIAEMLSREDYRIIYVSDMGIANATEVIGSAPYHYFYWDARARGYLYEHPAREAVLDTRARLDEERLGELLNSFLNFNDLWNYVAYTTAATVISPLSSDRFWQPRRTHIDPEPDPPPASRYTNMAANVDIYIQLSALKASSWWPAVQSHFEAALPDPIRRATIVSLCLNSPGISELAPKEAQQNWLVLRNLTAERIAAAGAHPIYACDGFTREDYIDRVHLAISGGQKFAERIAASVRELNAAQTVPAPR